MQSGFRFDGREYTTIHFPGSLTTQASDISESGQIVGFYFGFGANDFHGFVLNNGTYTTLDFPGSRFNIASGINSFGTVVGSFLDLEQERVRGYTFVQGSWGTIDFPGALHTYASDINDYSVVVGVYVTQGPVAHGFWMDAQGFHAIDFPGAVHTDPASINRHGRISGTYTDSSGKAHGFVAMLQRDRSDPFTVVVSGFTTVDFPAAGRTWAGGINAAGTIVGTFEDGTQAHGFRAMGGATFAAHHIP